MRVDLHIHTHYSEYAVWWVDAVGSPKQVIERAQDAGLDYIAITDHDTVAGAIEAQQIARDTKGVEVIPGLEISSADGHILGLNVTERIPAGLVADETIKAVHKQGGLAVAAHPGRSNGVSPKPGMEFDAIEGWNARSSRRQNEAAVRLAGELGIPVIAGSDAHHWKHVGQAHTVIEGSDPLAAIKAGTTQLVRGTMTTASRGHLYAAKLRHNLLNRK